MPKIKVGQIYKTPSGFRYVVQYDHNPDGFFPDEIIVRYNTKPNIPEVSYWTPDEILIAEYPTWQEAVNSPEFKGEK